MAWRGLSRIGLDWHELAWLGLAWIGLGSQRTKFRRGKCQKSNCNEHTLVVVASASMSYRWIVRTRTSTSNRLNNFRYFRPIVQGTVCNAISDHYLPISISSPVPKKPTSYALSIIDKLDTLVGFYLINEIYTFINTNIYK